MANIPVMNAMTATDLAYLIPEKWDTRILHNAYQEDFWGKFRGPEGGRQPIIEKEDFTKEPGDIIHIQTLSNLIGAGTTGETLLAGREEKFSDGQFNVTIENLYHAVALTDKANEQTLINDIVVAGKKLSPWLAQKLSDDVFKALLITATNATTLYAGVATSEATLLPTHTISLSEISLIKLALVRKGAMPLVVRRRNGQIERWYGIVMSGIDEYRLTTTGAWAQAQREANIRGEDNPIFTGALGVYDGCLLYSYAGLADESDTKGTPLRPEAVLKTAVDLTSASPKIIVVGSGTDDKKDYTRNFKTSGKLRFISATTGAVIERAKYTGKCNWAFQGVESEGFSGELASPSQIAAGSIITQDNVASVLGFGAEIAARAWGMHPKKIANSQSYGQLLGVGIKAVYGLAAIKNTHAKFPNFVILKTYSANPGLV